jgi:hypothetical protein
MNKKDYLTVDLDFSVSDSSIDILSGSDSDTILISGWENYSSYDVITSEPPFDTTWFDEWCTQQEWQEIIRASQSNIALQNAIERVKILYYLSKEDGNSETRHQT